jgi:hypothetical protein
MVAQALPINTFEMYNVSGVEIITWSWFDLASRCYGRRSYQPGRILHQEIVFEL